MSASAVRSFKSAVPRASARGIVAAMAMTGMRKVTTGLGLLHQTPPEEVAEHGLPHLFDRIDPEYRAEAIELAHWAFGAFAGAAYGFLPRAIRRHVWAGPAYGLASWTLFERVLTPVLGLRPAHHRTLSERAVTAADHVLYGAIIGTRPQEL